MVFVNTDLDVALERNQLRDRKLPSELVKSSWQAVQNNMGKFQSLFGRSNMLIVDNSEYKNFEDVVICILIYIVVMIVVLSYRNNNTYK